MLARQLYYKLQIVGLTSSAAVCRFVSAQSAANGTAVSYNIALFRVGLGRNRLHQPAALGKPVPRIFVQMLAPKAKGAMVAGGIAQGGDFLSAVTAYKARVVF